MIKRNLGFSVIELLIAMIVATIIITGIYSFLTSSHRSLVFVRANDAANRSMIISNRTVSDYLRMAGFRNYRRVVQSVKFEPRDVEFPSGTNISFNEISQFVASNDNESIVVRFFGSSIDDQLNRNVEGEANPDNRMFDCEGVPLDRTQEAFIRLYIDDENGLMCEQRIKQGDDFDDAWTRTVVLNPNIIQLRFALRIEGDDSFQYIDEIVHDEDLANADAIRYGFLVRVPSGQRLNPKDSTNISFHMLGFSDDTDKCVIGDSSGSTPKCYDKSDAKFNIYNLVTGLISFRNQDES